MANCVRNIRTKKYRNLIIGFQVTVENVGDVFLRHSVDRARWKRLHDPVQGIVLMMMMMMMRMPLVVTLLLCAGNLSLNNLS